MNSGFQAQCAPSTRLLAEEQIVEIHRARLGLDLAALVLFAGVLGWI